MERTNAKGNLSVDEVVFLVLTKNVAMMYNRLVDAGLDAKIGEYANGQSSGTDQPCWATGFIGTNVSGLVAVSNLFGICIV